MPRPRPKQSRAKPRQPQAAKWASLEQRLERAEGTWCVEEGIINLPGWRTIKYYETSDDITVAATLITEPANPCICGAYTFQKGGHAALSYVHDLPIRCKRTRIYFARQRYRCACGKTFQQPLAGLDRRHKLTARLAEYIEREAFSIFRTFSRIADEVGVSEQLVRNLLTDRGEQLERARHIETPKWLAIDEVYAGKNEHCVLTDPVRRRVIDMLPGNDQTVLGRYLLQLPDRENVEVVTMDMCLAYRAVMQQLLPRARVVVDRYHVHNLLSVALKQVLKVIRDDMTSSEQRQHMRHECLLLMSRYRLSGESGTGKNGKVKSSQLEVVKRWLEDVPDIATAYLLKEDFSDILQLADRQWAEERTDRWLERVWEFAQYFSAKYKKEYSGIWQDPFGNVVTTIQQWRSMILNYIDFKSRFEIKATNAFAEFANRQIKRAYGLGNGLTYAVLRMKVIYGGLIIKQRPPHPADEGKPRTRLRQVPHQDMKHRSEKNPNANVVRLEQARKDRDETKDLLPNPKANQGWEDRFGELDQLELGFGQEAPPKSRKRQRKGKSTKQPDTPNQRRRLLLKNNPDQIKLF
jgi:transposase